MRSKENKEKSPLREAFMKMADLCARSEQCAFDIRRKLRLKGFGEIEVAKVIAALERRRFLDSGRFARSFASDKLRFAGWGRVKIRAALLQRCVPEHDISAALDELDAEDYRTALMNAARSRSARADLNVYAERVKVMRHLVSRGFTPAEASRALAELKSDEE